MKERGDRLCAERKYCLREWLARLFGRQASRAASLSMIENENTEDPVRENPTADHEIDSWNQDHGPADLGKAELWAERLLGAYWDGKFPVDPNSIAVKMGMEVYFVPIPGGLAGVILKTKKEEAQKTGKEETQKTDEDEAPKILVDNNASTSRKRFTIAHELGHYVERFSDSESPDQKIPGHFGFRDKSMTSDEKILGSIRSTDSRTPDQSERELFADYFACCLLIPEDKVLEFINKGANIKDVATYFGVSAATMRNRLNDLGIDFSDQGFSNNVQRNGE